jgi:hypothetical protein
VFDVVESFSDSVIAGKSGSDLESYSTPMGLT